MLSPTTRSLQNLKLRLSAGSIIPEDKASQTMSVSFSLRQSPLLNNTLKGELTIKNRMRFFLIKMYKYYQKVTNHKKNSKILIINP